MRLLIVTDAWRPQVNGVVRTLGMVADALRAEGHVVEIAGPDRFTSCACPTYPEIRLALLPGRRLARIARDFRPDALHIATEGPLGMAARRWALTRGLDFTTSFHTRFPEYLHARFGMPVGPAYGALRWFHGAAAATLVPTASIARDLAARGFGGLRNWTRGVDLSGFRPGGGRDWQREFGRQGPYFLSVGRVAVEKNLDAFLRLDLPGSKIVVGDGPARADLQRRYPDALFVGTLEGEALRAAYAGSDVFVFPSRTDTFGLVILEALACGLPVASFNAPGPADIFAGAPSAIHACGDDLQAQARALLTTDRDACRAWAERFDWAACAAVFARHLVPLRRPARQQHRTWDAAAAY
ncbi:glycosyltransferase family 1 protein [Ameyamaea chiangmaiensis]|nr:glycosyltransferase family 1 protein [Ameyamaea chiangmaiensis]MBS4076008.1 glycosyltransferase family 1 protein [Ameyamaea chiangmaiensis]